MEGHQPLLAALDGADVATKREAHLAQADVVKLLYRCRGTEHRDVLVAPADDDRVTILGALREFGEVAAEDPETHDVHAEDVTGIISGNQGVSCQYLCQYC